MGHLTPRFLGGFRISGLTAFPHTCFRGSLCAGQSRPRSARIKHELISHGRFQKARPGCAHQAQSASLYQWPTLLGRAQTPRGAASLEAFIPTLASESSHRAE